MHQVERAIFDLRRGLPVVIVDEAIRTLVYPVEGIRDRVLQEILVTAGQQPSLVLTGHRLGALGHRVRADVARLPLAAGVEPDARRICAQAFGQQAPSPNPFLDPRPAGPGERSALALMRRALLIPAALTARIDPSRENPIDRLIDRGELLQVDAESAARCFEQAAGMLKRVSEARVPLEDAEDAHFVLFREPDGLREHVAVLIGQPDQWPRDVPVRMHSSCLTGDLFGSLRCDCGEQLRTGVGRIREMGGGVLLYLSQEGRGIGLANKLRAYALQDAGYDTVDADQILGFGQDERNYRVAVDMLAALEIRRIRLLTNNPLKIRALTEGGIQIAGRDGLYGRVNSHNRRYLSAKATRSGHLLTEVLNG